MALIAITATMTRVDHAAAKIGADFQPFIEGWTQVEESFSIRAVRVRSSASTFPFEPLKCASNSYPEGLRHKDQISLDCSTSRPMTCASAPSCSHYDRASPGQKYANVIALTVMLIFRGLITP
jgi:hypothetical protein